jgi:hypothetical protein
MIRMTRKNSKRMPSKRELIWNPQGPVNYSCMFLSNALMIGGFPPPGLSLIVYGLISEVVSVPYFIHVAGSRI